LESCSSIVKEELKLSWAATLGRYVEERRSMIPISGIFWGIFWKIFG
jgi:hypothetical protein